MMQELVLWGDNGGDFKGGDMWSQWGQHVSESADLRRVVLSYHAPGEGKTHLDAHFGVMKGNIPRQERAGLEWRSVQDWLEAMAKVEATHPVHVMINREGESALYLSAKGITKLHRIEIDATGKLTCQADSTMALKELTLAEVRARKTKRTKKRRAEAPTAVALDDECQKCCTQLKKREDVTAWIQCEECARSWHKTCVGVRAETPVKEVQWSKCAKCGGEDPAGEKLVKRRQASLCPVCHLRLRLE